MKQIKKVLAILVSLAMVLGMSITTFAAGPATITVNNAAAATLTYAQVIVADQTTTTGWAFCSTDIADAYKSAFGLADDQAVIKKMTGDLNGNTSEIAKALSSIANGSTTFAPMTTSQTVDKAGVYLIKATEPEFTYNTMSAYVGFGPAGAGYPTLTGATVTAKKSPIEVVKDNNDDDDVVAVGDTMTFTVKAYVPNILPTSQNKSFIIYDELKGATYGDLTKATVKVGARSVDNKIVLDPNGKGFSLNLSDQITDSNIYAGDEVVVTYEAVVNAVTVNNKASAGNTTRDEFGSDEENAYTGLITLTKFAEDNTTKLANAGFEVAKNGGAALTFVQDKDADGKEIKGSYTYSRTGTTKEVFTDENGKLVVQGLDIGKYHFTEKTAPEGYSINADGADATISVGNEAVNAVIEAETSLNDTRLSSLPETGGIGTTIFTIGGCLIMIIAAALFFRSRKKSIK